MATDLQTENADVYVHGGERDMWTGLWKSWGAAATAATLLVAGAAPVRAEATAPAGAEVRESLPDLLRHAVAESPGLAAMRSRVEAAGEVETRVRALPDPEVGAMLMFRSEDGGVGTDLDRVSFRQMFPGPGKRDAEAGLARADLQVERERYRGARLALEADVAEAYFDLHRALRGAEITRDNRDLVVYLEGVVRKAYEAGTASYADLLRIQVEIGRLENDLRSLEDALVPARARLNALLHRPADAPLPRPALPEPPPPLPDAEALRARYRDGAPDLRVLGAEIDAGDRTIEAADLSRRPDWSLSADWVRMGPAMVPAMPRTGEDAWMVGVMVGIPLHRSRYDALAREARARRAAAESDRAAAADDLARRLEALLYEVRNADREVRLYRDTLLPKARQSLQASDAGFRAGTVLVSDLVEAQQILLQFELAYEEARAARASSVARLRATVGDEVVVDGDAGAPTGEETP